jgi:hypothetical protein
VQDSSSAGQNCITALVEAATVTAVILAWILLMVQQLPSQHKRTGWQHWNNSEWELEAILQQHPISMPAAGLHASS